MKEPSETEIRDLRQLEALVMRLSKALPKNSRSPFPKEEPKGAAELAAWEVLEHLKFIRGYDLIWKIVPHSVRKSLHQGLTLVIESAITESRGCATPTALPPIGSLQTSLANDIPDQRSLTPSQSPHNQPAKSPQGTHAK